MSSDCHRSRTSASASVLQLQNQNALSEKQKAATISRQFEVGKWQTNEQQGNPSKWSCGGGGVTRNKNKTTEENHNKIIDGTGGTGPPCIDICHRGADILIRLLAKAEFLLVFLSNDFIKALYPRNWKGSSCLVILDRGQGYGWWQRFGSCKYLCKIVPK